MTQPKDIISELRDRQHEALQDLPSEVSAKIYEYIRASEAYIAALKAVEKETP